MVINRKIIRARMEVGNKCRLYKHFVVVAAKNKRAGREIAILLCEVPSNKDTEKERGREREATAAVELMIHSTHTKSICAEVVGNT